MRLRLEEKAIVYSLLQKITANIKFDFETKKYVFNEKITLDTEEEIKILEWAKKRFKKELGFVAKILSQEQEQQ
jgi:hypothetical protein